MVFLLINKASCHSNIFLFITHEKLKTSTHYENIREAVGLMHEQMHHVMTLNSKIRTVQDCIHQVIHLKHLEKGQKSLLTSCMWIFLIMHRNTNFKTNQPYSGMNHTGEYAWLLNQWRVREGCNRERVPYLPME